MLDPIEMQQAGERLGAGQYARYLPVIFTGRTVDRYGWHVGCDCRGVNTYGVGIYSFERWGIVTLCLSN